MFDVIETPASHLIEARLAGVSFGNRQAMIAELQPGDQLWLLREPNNSYDRNAIQVVNGEGECVGYLPRDLAALMAPLLDHDGVVWPAEVLAINDCGQYGANLGVTIGFMPPDSEHR